MMRPELLNWEQACKVLGCGKTHFYYLVNSGHLPAQRSGKVKGIRVKNSDCENLIQKWQKNDEI